MENIWQLWKNPNISIISRCFGAGCTPYYPWLHIHLLNLSHNFVPVPYQNIHGCLRQMHHHNIKQLFSDIYSSFLSNYDYSLFPLCSGDIILLMPLFACIQLDFCSCEKLKVDITDNISLNLCSDLLPTFPLAYLRGYYWTCHWLLPVWLVMIKSSC